MTAPIAKKPKRRRNWTFKIIQRGVEVAFGSGPNREEIRREAAHYALMYALDGPLIMGGSAVRGMFRRPPAIPFGEDDTPTGAVCDG